MVKIIDHGYLNVYMHISKSVCQLLLATVSILAGGTIYIIFRATNLIMFSWFDTFGLTDLVNSMRYSYGHLNLSPWIVYNLPAALWLFSYLLYMSYIWRDQPYSITKITIIWCLPACAVICEILQLFHLIQGTFDIKDIIAYLLAAAIYLLIYNFNGIKNNIFNTTDNSI